MQDQCRVTLLEFGSSWWEQRDANLLPRGSNAGFRWLSKKAACRLPADRWDGKDAFIKLRIRGAWEAMRMVPALRLVECRSWLNCSPTILNSDAAFKVCMFPCSCCTLHTKLRFWNLKWTRNQHCICCWNSPSVDTSKLAGWVQIIEWYYSWWDTGGASIRMGECRNHLASNYGECYKRCWENLALSYVELLPHYLVMLPILRVGWNSCDVFQYWVWSTSWASTPKNFKYQKSVM